MKISDETNNCFENKQKFEETNRPSNRAINRSYTILQKVSCSGAYAIYLMNGVFLI